MTKQELLKAAQEETDKVAIVIGKIPDEIDELGIVDFASNMAIYFKVVNTFKEHTDMLHLLLGHWGKYEIYTYNASGQNLYIGYKFPEHEITAYFYCEERDIALAAVGQGKCRIEEKWSTPYKHSTVVCEGI